MSDDLLEFTTYTTQRGPFTTKNIYNYWKFVSLNQSEIFD